MNKNIFRFTGLTLIFAGLTSFFLTADRPFTTMIGPFVGVVILFLSISIDRQKNQFLFGYISWNSKKHINFWISLGLSALFSVLCIKMAFNYYEITESAERFRNILVFWTMGLATGINALYLLYLGFIKKSE